MRYAKNLEDIEMDILPARLLVLLSKYSRALHQYNGMTLRLHSKNIFRNLHNANMLADDAALHTIYHEILAEINHQGINKHNNTDSPRHNRITVSNAETVMMNATEK